MKRRVFALLALLLASTLCAKVMMNDVFIKNMRTWTSPNYWPGSLEHTEIDGQKCILLKNGQRGETFFGRAYGVCTGITLYPHLLVRITISARGQGELLGGLLTYAMKSGQPSYLPGDKKPLTDKFQNYVFELELPKKYGSILPYFEVHGKDTQVYVSQVKMETFVKDGVSFKALTSMLVVKDESGLKPIVFDTGLPNADVYVTRITNTDEYTEVQEKTDSSGRLVTKAGELKPGLQEVAVSERGDRVSTYIAVDSPQVYDATDALAAKLKLAKPINILLIGDSLSDYYRGYNFMDRLKFWADKYNPGKLTFRNAGVGGDYVERCVGRFKGMTSKTKEYRQEMYNGLWDVKYDYVLIFLGQNDTRCVRSQQFSKPYMSPEKQENNMRFIIEEVRRHSQAKIVMISPSSSNVQLFQEQDRKFPAGREIYMYGKVEFVDGFRDMVLKMCGEFNLDFVDILTPMRNYANIADLFVEDGVHLSPKGGRLISDELLKYFAK